ncbi:hypothetical protein AVEN_91207-1 [Araneus ventricosus]|uniref:Mos1 transposase HTH domain-containing protein n=1 Tax=Araneus ventricosus TaxID=182803 RepID=A0A4Y2X1H4_ARAVE|nr:hypothetical protein AVEN_271782-1 [Araneus ventricosus]GBO43381.1 hypothetical protein AVEN_91207-1 [Araneus ventricosus]
MACRIDAPAKRDVRSVIRFLQAEGNSELEIYRRISRAYGENFMSDCVVCGWRIKFKDWRTDVHEEKGQGRKSVATEYLASSQQLLEQFKWDVSDHPALAPT